MKKNRVSVKQLFISEDLPFENRILNFVCFLGVCAAAISLIARIIQGMPLASLSTMYIMLAAILCLFGVSALRLGPVSIVTALVVFGLGNVFFPLLYFTNGGADSGMAAYFTLAIILQFLLLKGKTRVTALVLTTASIFFTYYVTIFAGWSVLPQGGMSDLQRFVDNMQSILVAGFFMGAVIVFQNWVYLKEKSKAEAAGKEIMRSEELLTLVNEAATRLLTTEPDKFEDALIDNMKKMGECLDIDCVYIWRLCELEGAPFYSVLYSWFSPGANVAKSFEAVAGSNVIPRMPEWDDKMLGERGYMSEPVSNFSGFVRDKLAASGVKSIMAFPVFFSGQLLGLCFV